MEVKVRFRFNKATGEVELFEVEDEGTMHLPEAEHNRQHDRIAAELGNVVELNPLVIEVRPGAGVPVLGETVKTSGADEVPEPKIAKEKQKL